MSGRRIHTSVAVGLLLVIAVTGCSRLGINLPGHAVYKDIRAQLDETSGSTSETMHLADVVDGEWTRVIVVCDGATASQIDDALGFSWSESTIVDDGAFLGMFVFADQAKVTDYYSAGKNDSAENLDLVPCQDPEELTADPLARVFAFDRSDSDIQFRYWAKGNYWYSLSPGGD